MAAPTWATIFARMTNAPKYGRRFPLHKAQGKFANGSETTNSEDADNYPGLPR